MSDATFELAHAVLADSCAVTVQAGHALILARRVVSDHAELATLRAALTRALDGWARCGDTMMYFGDRIAELRKLEKP